MTTEEEVKDEQAVGRVWFLLAKNPRTWMIVAALAGGAGIYRETTRPGQGAEAFSADEMRGLLRKEIAPLRAGIEELAKGQSLKVQNNVLQAMLKAERRNAETQ